MKDIDNQLFYQLNEVEERINWIHNEIMDLLNLDKKDFSNLLNKFLN